MPSTSYSIVSADGTKLNFRHWRVDNPKICICLIHGLGDHSGRYEQWSSMFTQQNIAVCAIDFRGHGLSEGKRGHARSFEKIFEDIDRLLTEAEAHYPEVGKILYGHSLGGNLVVNYYIKRKPNVSGIVITSPWFRLVKLPNSALVILSKLMNYIHPAFTAKNQLNAEDLSRNKSVVAQYTSDKLVHDRISVKMYFQAKYFGEKVMGKGFMINKPLLIMHGSADNITSHKASVGFSRNTGQFTTFKSWEGCYHELHNEPNNKEIFDFLINWISDNYNI